MPTEKYQKNRCDRERPDCFPHGIGAECWTPKELKKYGVQASEVGPELCIATMQQEHEDTWYNCMQTCYTNAYGTAGIDRAGEREAEERKRKEQDERKRQEALERALRGEPVTPGASTEERTETPAKNEATTEDGPKSRSGRRKTTKKENDFRDTMPIGVAPSAVRVLWLCREKCGDKVVTNFKGCYCDRVRCGPEEEEFPENITIGIGDNTKPVADGTTDKTDEEPVDREDTFEDIRYTVSEYGVPIERPYGLTGVSGNIVWAGPGIDARSATFALALGDARTAFVRRVWFNDVLIYARGAETASFGTFVGGDIELVADKLFFYKGGDDALPVAEMGEIQIGYRDLSILLFKNFDVVVDDQFPRIRVEVSDGSSTVGVVSRALPAAFTPTRAAAFGTDMLALFEGDTNRLDIVSGDGSVLYSENGINTVNATLIDPAALLINRATGINSYYFDGAVNAVMAAPGIYDGRGPVDIITNIKSPSGTVRSTLVTAIANGVDYHRRVNAVFDAAPFASFTDVISSPIRWIAEVTSDVGTTGLFIAPVSGLSKLTVAAIRHVSASGVGPRTGDTVEQFEILYPSALAAATFETIYTSGDSVVFVGRLSGGLAAFSWSYASMSIKWHVLIPLRAPYGNARYGAGRNVGSLVILASANNVVALNIASGAVVHDEAIVSGGAHVQFSTNEIYVNGSIYVMPDSIAGNTTAGDILAEELTLAGYGHDEFDVGDVTSVVLRGYKISAKGALNAFMQEMAETALITIDTANGYVVAKKQVTQYGTPQINVHRDDVSDDTKENRFYLASQRMASEVAVTYVADEARLVLQTANYKDETRSTFRYVFSTNATMTEAEARNLAEYLASTVIEDGDEIKFRVGPAYIGLTPGTVVSYTVGNVEYNWAIKTADIGANLSVDVTLRRVFTPRVLSLPSVYVTDPYIVPTVYKNGVARPVILNVRPVGSAQVPSNGALKVYAVVKGVDVGATALIKWRDGRYASRALVAGPVLSGALLNTPPHPFDTYVSQSTSDDFIVVRFDRDVSSTTFEDADYVSVVAGDSEYRNMLLVGTEWVQFGSLTVGPDNRTVTFTQVARGLRGTETEISASVAGATVYHYSFSTFGEFTYSEREVATGVAVVSATNTAAKTIVRDTVEIGLSMRPSWPWPITTAKLSVLSPSQLTFDWYPRSQTAVGLDDDTFTSRLEASSGTFAIIIAGGHAYTEAMLRADIRAAESGLPLVHAARYVIVQNSVASLIIDKYPFTAAGLDWNTDTIHISVAELPSASFFAAQVGGIYTIHTYAPATMLPLRQQIVTVQ